MSINNKGTIWTTKEEEEKDPEWVKSEKDQFQNQWDKDRDGRLNREELGKWFFPMTDYAEDEAKHLIQEGDSNMVSRSLRMNTCLQQGAEVF